MRAKRSTACFCCLTRTSVSRKFWLPNPKIHKCCLLGKAAAVSSCLPVFIRFPTFFLVAICVMPSPAYIGVGGSVRELEERKRVSDFHLFILPRTPSGTLNGFLRASAGGAQTSAFPLNPSVSSSLCPSRSFSFTMWGPMVAFEGKKKGE